MKVVFEYDGQEREEILLVVHSGLASSIIREVDQRLRDALKHGGDLRKTAEDCRQILGDYIWRIE